MTMDWCPGIREACSYWRDATMLQQTFQALEVSFINENDASIDCAKAVVEAVCRVIVENFHTQQNSLRPPQENPKLSHWLSAAVRALKLGDIRDVEFQKLVSSHNKLADALNDFRNKAGPISHGKEPFLDRLTTYHQRVAVLAADTIVTYLHQAYLSTQPDFSSTREPWDKFGDANNVIDRHVKLAVNEDDEGSLLLQILLPNDEQIPLKVELSRILYEFDRGAYIEALNAARGVVPVDEE